MYAMEWAQPAEGSEAVARSQVTSAESVQGISTPENFAGPTWAVPYDGGQPEAYSRDTFAKSPQISSIPGGFAGDAMPDGSPQRTLSLGSVADSGVTVHRVRLGSKVQQIKVSRSAGVQVGNHNLQVNHYRFKLDRPQMSLDHLVKKHPAALRSLERLAVNPHSWTANYAFRQHLSAGPTRPTSRVMFAGASSSATVRISARVNEYGAMVVANSRGVQVTDHGIQRNDFNYKSAGQEISPERILHDRPDLVRSLAMTIRHPGNAAVQRSFERQFSSAYTHRGAPSLKILNQDWPGRSVSAEHGTGVQVGTGNSQKNTVSVDIRRMALTGWESTAERIAAKIEEPATLPGSIDELKAVSSPADTPATWKAPAISWPSPVTRSVRDTEDIDPADLGPSIDAF